MITGDKTSSNTNLTGRFIRRVEHYKVPKEHPILKKEESREIRPECSDKNLTRTSDRKLKARLVTVVDVFKTPDHSRDGRCEYPDKSKGTPDV